MNQSSNTSLGMAEISTDIAEQKMSQWFKRFSEQTAGSPMYQYLSLQVSEDSELLNMAQDTNPKQPAPNLFFASIQFLLMQNPSEELSKYYPSIGGTFEASPQMFTCFKDFCMKSGQKISELLKTRLVQTNEVQRCALLSPAVNFVSQKSGRSKIALVDVGVSGGLNFLLDRSFIQYTDGQTLGSEHSTLRLRCESKGNPILQGKNAEITNRIGIDLNPINLLDEKERQWNLALIWPDQLERIERFKTAIQLLKTVTIQFERGSGIEVLSQVASKISNHSLFCVMHSFTLNQFSKEDREIFENILTKISNDRDVWRISLEWIGTPQPEILISQYSSGKKISQLKVAECSGHGEWIRWIV
jgi:hypothetical protein